LLLKASVVCYSEKLGYSCCSDNKIYYTDNDDKWEVENDNWCGIVDASSQAACWSLSQGLRKIVQVIYKQFKRIN